MKKLLLPIALALLLVPGSASAQEYRVIALPDTQNYSADYPQIYNSQTQYCADRYLYGDVRFVTHLGDIVDEAATLWQWDNARVAMNFMDAAGVPYGTCVGNHDIRYPGSYYDPDGLNYLAYFGPAFYQGEPWFGGASPSGLSNYQIIDAGDREMLYLHILVETPAAELAWAQGVLTEHRDKPVLLSTHRYLFNWLGLTGRYGDLQYLVEPLYRHDGIKADDFFHNFVATNRQIFMVYCGHCAGEHRQTSQNNFGLPVFEILADYQDGYGSGGNGWLRILRFQEAQEQLHTQTYSPWLDDWRTGSDSDFVYSLDLDDYLSLNPTLHFQQGVSGYNGTFDTHIKEANPGNAYGNSSIVVVDDDTENSWFDDYEGQGLFRFGGIFQDPVYEGDPPPTLIPRGATIHTAVMTINLEDDTNLEDPEFYVYRMLVDWTENATWNSLGGGVDPGVDCEANWIAMFYGDNDPNYDYNRRFSILDAIQDWADGEPNYGVAILPERLNFNDDGIEIHSSEWGSVVVRPALDVEFSYTMINVQPTITSPLAADPPSANEGDTVVLSIAAEDPNPLDPLVFSINGVDVGYATGSGSIDHDVLVEDEGIFDFTGAVSDDEVEVWAGDATVVVYNVAPTIVELTDDLSVSVGDTFDFSADATDPGIWDTLTYAWDCDDDGSYDDVIGASGQWSFAASGIYPVRVEVLDGDGGAAYGEFIVRVLRKKPYLPTK